MSYLRLNIRDQDRVISGDVHGVTGERLVAALSAEPETIEELEKAIERFAPRESDWSEFERFAKHENLEPYDAGILVIDLAGRTIAVESSYAAVSMNGNIAVKSDFIDESVNIPYRLPGDWRIVHSIPEYEGVGPRRREQRSKNLPFDARQILYERPLLEFIAQECMAVKDLSAQDINVEIHVKWLMTSREDLFGTMPRELLLEKQDSISWDLHSRSLQWSFTKVEPPPLPPDARAYLSGGFGTNEIVVYYDLVRVLIDSSLERRKTGKFFSIDEEIERLSELKNEWLAAPSGEFSGRTPAAIVESERRRINMTMSAHDYLFDEDCPCCSSLAAEFDTPMFWSLDGSGMDDRFEFSFHKTLPEWEAEQLSYQNFNREFAEGKWQNDDDDFFDFENNDLLDEGEHS